MANFCKYPPLASIFDVEGIPSYHLGWSLVLLGFHQHEYHIKDDLGCQGTWVPHSLHFSAIPCSVGLSM